MDFSLMNKLKINKLNFSITLCKKKNYPNQGLGKWKVLGKKTTLIKNIESGLGLM